jgi:ABC-2 type transport system permease protein
MPDIETVAATAESANPSHARIVAESGFFLPMFTLAQREMIRFFRQRNRVVGALLQPLIFFVFFGAAFRTTFRAPEGMQDMSYMEYFFPGTIVMILLFTAIFSTISIIEDRKEGFLQSVLVSPVSRLSMVLGKILGGTLLAVFQGVLFFLAAFFLKIPVDLATFIGAFVIMVVIGAALTGLGFMIAWRMDSTQGFHAIMSVFLLPMWLLSGALFPAAGVPAWLEWMMKLNPLTYGLAAFRHVLYHGNVNGGMPSLGLSLLVTALFCLATIGGSVLLAGTRTTGDLQ